MKESILPVSRLQLEMVVGFEISKSCGWGRKQYTSLSYSCLWVDTDVKKNENLVLLVRTVRLDNTNPNLKI